MDSTTEIKTDARVGILRGAKQVYDVAAQVYGPTSSNVALEHEYGPATISHDGVSVLRRIKLADPVENIGAQLLIQASKKTNDIVGDATTGTAILAYHIMDKANKRLAAGYNPMALRRGIERASVWVKDQIDAVAVPVDDDDKLRQVAIISCGNEAEGRLVADTLIQVGARGGVTIQDYPGVELESEIVEGFYFEKGFADIRQVTDTEALEARYENVVVIVTEKRLNTNADLLALLKPLTDEANAKKQPMPAVLIVGDVSGDALATLVVNKAKGILNSVATSAPVYGDQKVAFLEDVAALTGATFIAEGSPLQELSLDLYGHANKIVVTQTSTTILGGQGDGEVVQQRVDTLVKQIADETSAFRKERMEMRLAKLSGRVGLIKVGGATEVEMKERKFRIEDAVAATKAARDGGIVPGGATTLLRISWNDLSAEDFANPDEYQGLEAVLEALAEPFNQIVTNAGLDAGYLRRQVLESKPGYGFDVKAPTDKPVDLLKVGVVDPAKAIKQTVENACSVAGMAVTTGSAITIVPKESATNA